MREQAEYLHINSPVGPLELEADGTRLSVIRFTGFRQKTASSSSNKVLADTEKQLKEYFEGKRTDFDLPFCLNGTDFQKRVWEKLQAISYGSFITYAQLAKQLGDIKKVRAVGRANGKNPLPIVIPCHRVIGADNKLVGYGGGIENKRWLLRHEGALLL